MTKPKSNILFQILSLGNQDDTPFRVAYKNYMFNLFLLMATPFAFLVMCINFYHWLLYSLFAKVFRL